MDAEEETVGCGAAFCRGGAAVTSQGRSLTQKLIMSI
jgi:hypothetical protein